MNLRRILSVLLLLMVMTALVVPAGAQDSKIATLIFTQEPDNLNPLYTDMWFSGITRDFWLQGMLAFDGDLNPVPALAAEVPSAENGGISADGLTITFRLKDGLTWSDGTALTSADFLFTYEMVLAEANTVNSRYPYESDIVASVEAPDAQTVVVNFVQPFAPWMTSVFTYVLPEHVLRPVFDEAGTLDDADWNRAPSVGVGPFVYQEWEPAGHLLLTRNENYFQPALLDGVFIRFVEDDAAQIAALISGEGDIGTFIAYSDFTQLEEAGVTPILVNSGYNEAWFFNTDPATAHPAMTDPNVRRAVGMAFNRQEVVDTLLEGRTSLPGSFWEGTPFDNPAIEPLPYDPAAAAAMLDEAGWVDSNGNGVRDKDGVELELRYLTTTRQIRVDTQVIAQQDLAEIGVSLILLNEPSDIFFSGYGQGGPVSTGQYDIAEWSTTGAFPDPNTSQFLCSEIPSDENPEGSNDTRYCREEVDALFQQQTQTVDFAARQQIFFRIQELMYEDTVWLGVWYDPDAWAINSRMVNVSISGATPFWNAAEWDIQ